MKHRLPISLAVVAAVTGGLAARAADAPGECVLRAVVVDAAARRPLPGAEVMLRLREAQGPINMGIEPEPVARAFTDKEGNVVFSPLSRDESYYAVVRFPGFQATWSEIPCGVGSDGATSIELHEFETISMVQLIADPGHWDGRYVQVVGFLNLEFEGDALYLHREDWKRGLTKNALWVEVDSKRRAPMSRLSREYVILAGVFDGKRHGHGALFSGTLRDVSRCDPWQ